MKIKTDPMPQRIIKYVEVIEAMYKVLGECLREDLSYDLQQKVLEAIDAYDETWGQP